MKYKFKSDDAYNKFINLLNREADLVPNSTYTNLVLDLLSDINHDDEMELTITEDGDVTSINGIRTFPEGDEVFYIMFSDEVEEFLDALV